jgi:hypothetical protein
MPVESLTASQASKRLASMPEPVSPSEGERWAAWRARGADHDRAVGRKLAIAAPILVTAAAVLYAVLAR